MIISDENSYPILIDNIDIPITTTHYWCLDLAMRDFRLTPLVMFEEITAPILVLIINGYSVEIPCDWNVLIYSDDTSQLDVIEASDLTKGNFSAFLFDHDKNKLLNNKITVVDYKQQAIVHTPSLTKNLMLCHAIGPSAWVCISPSDTYLKYLKDATVGDLL